MTIVVFEHWTWPWSAWTLHVAYLASGIVIAVHYVPQVVRAWRFPLETLAAQSLVAWSVWTLCRAIAFVYGLFVIHDLVFLLVVAADILGRLAMVALILRAHALSWSTRVLPAMRPH